MTDVQYVSIAAFPTIEIPHPNPKLHALGRRAREGGVNAAFAAAGCTVARRQRSGGIYLVSVEEDLTEAECAALKATLEASGRCAGVVFP